VSSYTKQMMEVAAVWLAANPDPKNPFIKVPGLRKNSDHTHIGETDAVEHWEKKKAANVPEAKPLLAELRRVQDEYDETLAGLQEHETKLEAMLNATGTMRGEVKDIVDVVYHAPVGRWCLAWARHGYNVFELSTDFTAAILLTDAKELDITSVRLPFAGLLMLVPDSFARGAEGGSYTKIHIHEIPRSDVRQLKAASKIEQAMKDLSRRDRRTLLDDLAASPTFGKPASKSLLPDDPADTVLHIYASDGTHSLTTMIERKGLTWASFDDLPSGVNDDTDQEVQQTLRQIVFGALAYTSTVERSVEPRDPTATKRKPSDKPRATHWTVGRTIKIDPRLVRAVRDGSRDPAFRLKHRHIVRGHYRNQAHGPKHSLRTSKWIAPYWKGPEEGARLVHTYVLDSETSDRGSEPSGAPEKKP
jgi:hypothetical protein